MNWIKNLFSKRAEKEAISKGTEPDLVCDSPKPTAGHRELDAEKSIGDTLDSDIPWDYIREAAEENDAFFDQNSESIPHIFERIRAMGRDPVVVLIALEQEKWRALLALLYKNTSDMLLTPEHFLHTTPTIKSNGYCNVYEAPVVNGKAMKVGIYGVEREMLLMEFQMMRDMPPMFTDLMSHDMEPPGKGTVVVLAPRGMRVEYL